MSASGGAPWRALAVSSPAIPLHLGRPALEPVRLSGHEGVNSLFEYELVLQTTSAFNGADGIAELDLDGFIGREISCSMELDGCGAFVAGAAGPPASHVGAGVRQINGLVTAAALAGEEDRHFRYRFTVRPWLHLASLNSDCKIFQNKTVVEILDELLVDYSFAVDKRLYERYPQRDYQTQFNESDFAFFERLCQEWGISYHFEHSGGKHRLVLCDAMAAFRPNPSAAYHQVPFHPPGWKLDAQYIHRFEPGHRLTSGKFSTRDYDYTRPRADLGASRSDARPTAQADAEVYQWHASHGGAHYAQPDAGSSGATGSDPHKEGRFVALLRMQALRTHGSRSLASGNLGGMVPGCTFELVNHPRRRANTQYLILDTELLVENVAQDSQPRAAVPSTDLAAQRWRIAVDFTAHPANEPLRPAPTRSKPLTKGPQTALVVGPQGQNLWTDTLGRIKVQFPWDRIGQRNENSSCWVRVSAPWAGNQLGGMHIPRIGQEVIVDFIGGDPDLPVCTGRLINQQNLPPWRLPGQSALSGFRSRELVKEGGNSAAGRSNHLVMDDTAGKMQVQLKSDHQHSQLSLGHITRIDDNGGRKDERGEGFELRTDGHAALRAKAGLLITADARDRAQGPIKGLDEAHRRLDDAHELHQVLASLAVHHEAQQGDEDQDAVRQRIEAQNLAIRGGAGLQQPSPARSDDAGAAFPELAEPHLLLTSPAGIEATTQGALHMASEVHTAITSGQHTSVAARKSFLASARQAIRLFAHKAGVRIFAARGRVQVQAQDDRIELLARKAVALITSAGEIRLKAKEGISLEAKGSTLLIDKEGFRFYTPAAHHVWSAGYQPLGPQGKPLDLPRFPRAELGGGFPLSL